MSLHIGSSNISDIYVGNSKISDIYVGNDLVYTSNKGPDLTVPLYFEAADPSVAVTVGFRKGSTENKQDPSGVDFSKYTGYSDPDWSYSYDGLTWSNYSIGNNITIGGSNPSRVYFKSRTNYTAIPWRGSYTDSSGKVTTTYHIFIQFTASGGNVNASGNIQSLLYSDFMAYDSALADCFLYMFQGCTSLIEAPELPATTLASFCYWNMFNSCTSLTSAPSLPATTMATDCYNGMFNSCTSLTSAPALPATTLAEGCYAYMFQGCTSLTSAPSLPATTMATYCYNSMFDGCTSLIEAPELPATTLASFCYWNMFNSCTSLTNAPSLPATTMATYCYSDMFSGIRANSTASAPCIYPYRIPESGTGAMDESSHALSGMFANIDDTATFTPTINTTFYISVPVMD